MSRALNSEEPRRQMLVSYRDARIIQTALQMAVGGGVDPADRQYLAANLRTVSMLWATTSGLRNALYDQNVRLGFEEPIRGASH